MRSSLGQPEDEFFRGTYRFNHDQLVAFNGWRVSLNQAFVWSRSHYYYCANRRLMSPCSEYTI